MRASLLILLFMFASPLSAKNYIPAEGESIYRKGVLLSGEAVLAEREPGVRIEGAEAACVNCHRRSGLGSAEGRTIIPPVTGNYLFRHSDQKVGDRDLPYVYGVRSAGTPYTEASVARTLREGINPDGRELSYLMPRFKLDDVAMSALIAYLRGLTSNQVPGVTDDTLHFATIITPDADPIQRQGMLDVLQHYFASKNAYYRESPRMHSSRGIMYRVNRKWQLHVWELTGSPESWERQLHSLLVSEPVYAVISGIGGKTWAPVHQFCEHESVPCMFPNVDLPVVAEQDFYSVYFSKGVLLEAELIRRRLEEAGLKRVIQIFRNGDIGEAAAAALSAKMMPKHVEFVNLILDDDKPQQELLRMLKDVDSNTAIVFWLRPQDLAALPSSVDGNPMVFMSGLMGGVASSALPQAWRSVAHIAYAFDLPEQRKIRMNYSSSWLKIQQIPIVDERTQANTYLACSILAETLGDMLDVFVRDYLVERVEDMLSRMPVTGYYPRLGLAPGQRFASKGGYIVRFADPQGTRLVADGTWLVP